MRVLVVDDEAPARQRLIDVLQKDAGIASVLEATDGIEAVTMIERERPDLVFLDVQMPELDGLGVIDAVGTAEMPLTVFVTAYDQHAIRAFESNALDYLLKPYSDERLEETLARARTRLTESQAGNLVRLLAAPQAGRYRDRLVLKSAGVTRFLRVDEIDWIEGAGIYVNLHVGGKTTVISLRSHSTCHEPGSDSLHSRPSLHDRQHRQHRPARCRLAWRVRCFTERRQCRPRQPDLSRAARAKAGTAAIAVTASSR